MSLLIGAWTVGLILAILALGVLISFRIFSFADITAEGSLTLGASVAASLLVKGYNPALSTLLAALAGMLAGLVTGLLATRFKINQLLSGILVMTALYSINLHIMGAANRPLRGATTLDTLVTRGSEAVLGAEQVMIGGSSVSSRDLGFLVAALAIVSVIAALLYVFLLTDFGAAFRATGDNSQMIRALGTNVEWMTILGLSIANGLAALAGAVFAQYQGFSDVQMGIGMLVWGLASVIIGETLSGTRSLGVLITATVMGSVVFRLLVATALRWGLNPNDLKLTTAAFVLAALILPKLLDQYKAKKTVPHAPDPKNP
jgi:putative ABC transport system permease protein